MISNVQVEHNFEVDRNQNVIIGVKTFLQVFQYATTQIFEKTNLRV